jgi:pyruvate ferredoxin oxidoreductase gamma subunit
MLRVRFHGRGGQGIKTASRILGTAAFQNGLHAQDSPIYGAERRGAALAAFTRIDTRPISERGPITHPHLIVIADETLLADAGSGALLGSEAASGVFVNSSREPAALARQHPISCPLRTVDLTALTIELLGRGVPLSPALGAAACALTGIGPVEIVARAVRDELENLHLTPEVVEKNVELARRVDASLAAIPIRDQPRLDETCPMRRPTYADTAGMPIIVATGNTPLRHTGSWRIFRPVIDLDACTRCGICFAFCPDGAIALDDRGYPVIDYDNCKGCMICSRECPLHCIGQEKEVRAW